MHTLMSAHNNQITLALTPTGEFIVVTPHLTQTIFSMSTAINLFLKFAS